MRPGAGRGCDDGDGAEVKLPCSTEESSCLQSTEEDMSAFSLRCSKGLLDSVWLGKSLMGPDMCLNLQE